MAATLKTESVLTEPPPSVPVKERRKYTTPDELAGYQDLVDKVFKRKTGKDRTKYRVVLIYPEFTGSTAEDLIDVHDADGEKIGEAYAYITRLNVENYEEEVISVGGKRIVQRKAIGSFNVDAAEFLQKFELLEKTGSP